MRNVVLVGLVGVLFCGGCTTTALDPNAIALAYYNQGRTYDPVRIDGVAEVTLKAAEGQTISLVLTSQLEPLSLYPRDPSTLKTLLEGAANIATVAGASLVGLELVEGLSQGPTIVEQPAPIIVGSEGVGVIQ